jgi:putative cardiolipin synthase
MVQPENSYTLALRPRSAESPPRLMWRTREDGQVVKYIQEPARSRWQRLKVKLLSWLPLDGEL